MKQENTPIDPAVDYDTEEVVSDLLYTLLLTMDEYVTYLKAHGRAVEDLTKMQQYVEKEMRGYAQKVYKVVVDKV